MSEAARKYQPLQHRHVTTMKLKRDDLTTIYRDSRKAAIGGKSRVRKKDRKEFLEEDQMVGLIGNYAFSLWRDGDPRAYKDMRHTQTRFSDKGDGGYDLPRLRFDIKASMMRYSQNVMKYNLPLQEEERHDGWAYGLALVEKFTIAGLKKNPSVTVHMVGWALDSELPPSPNGVGKLEGAFVIPVPNLHPFTPLRYD